MYVTEDQVRSLLSVPDCIEVLREAFSNDFVNIPRYRLKSKNSLLQVMSASIPDLGVMGLKSYGTNQNAATFAVLLFDEKSTALLCVIEADALGQIRTGAASGLATDLLSNPDASIGAVIGTGYQGETQLLAIDSVRRFKEIRIFSRNSENRKKLKQRLSGRVRAKLVDSDSAEKCVENADVICTITSSKEPVLLGSWLKPGCHINAAGSNWASKRELDKEAVLRCDFICVDHLEQTRLESGDLILVLKDHDWSRVVELKDVVKGEAGRSAPDQITLFKSNGIAMEDVAAARYLYLKVSKSGIDAGNS
jgi:ornithine cyclodeaminase/alanine dehydrogenase-like protein (mu-crystallin family)